MFLLHQMSCRYNYRGTNRLSSDTLCGRVDLVQTLEGGIPPPTRASWACRPLQTRAPQGSPHIHCQGAAPAETGRAREAHNKPTLSCGKQSVFVLLIKI